MLAPSPTALPQGLMKAGFRQKCATDTITELVDISKQGKNSLHNTFHKPEVPDSYSF